MLINEVYGPVIQGEGRSVGKRVGFIRAFSCHLHCSWCDSAQTWRVTDHHPHNFAPIYNKEEQRHVMSTEEIINKVIEMDVNELVLTGGEPMLQQDGFVELIQSLDMEFGSRYSYQFETAGTIEPVRELQLHPQVIFNVSPKLSNSGNPKHLRFKPNVLRAFRYLGNAAIFKFVLSSTDDFLEIEEILKEIGIAKRFVWIMLEGETAEKQVSKFHLVDEIINRGYNFSPRMHTMIWGNERGR